MLNLNEEIVKSILDKNVDNSITSWADLPHHSEMLNIDRAVNRFIQAVVNSEKILFVHDSDADGLGTYMLSTIFFKYFKYENIEIMITDRSNGYGFVEKYIDDRINNLPHLIITADNGITSIPACNRAYELGIDVIITDHHQVDSKRGLPDAIVVDPHQKECTFPYPDINGTFVYWYFLSAIAEISNTPIDMQYEFLPELCLTTISDVMPLTGINRFVVKEGLKAWPTHHRVWSQTFYKVFNKDDITSEDLAFNLIPSINVTSRLTNAEESAMFLTREEHQESLKWLKYLKTLNDTRKLKQEDLKQEIERDYKGWIDQPFILIPGENFLKGILGPTAGRLKEQYKKPTIVLSKNKAGTIYSGSGRSTGDIDLLGLVKDNPYVISDRTGGHKAACGVSFKVEDLNPFFQKLQEDTLKLDPKLYKDTTKEPLGFLELRNIDYQLFLMMEQYQPFGQKFETPMFQTRGTIKTLSKISKLRNHYTMTITDGLGCEIRAMWFFFNKEIKKNQSYNFLFNIKKDDFNAKKFNNDELIVLFIKEVIEI